MCSWITWKVVASLILSYGIFTSPILWYLHLSYPMVSSLILSYSIFTSPILWYLHFSYPIVSFFLSFLPLPPIQIEFSSQRFSLSLSLFSSPNFISSPILSCSARRLSKTVTYGFWSVRMWPREALTSSVSHSLSTWPYPPQRKDTYTE